MRYAVWVSCGLWAAVLTAAACGGSSSETPWPVEPENAMIGPSGEFSANPVVDEHIEVDDAGVATGAAERAVPSDAGLPGRRGRRPRR